MSAEKLSGGSISEVWLVTCEDATRLVAKTSDGAPSDSFPIETEGLTALRATQTVPNVVAAARGVFLLEELTKRVDRHSSWEAFARDLAALHGSTIQDGLGRHRDNYCGRLPQRNSFS